MAGDPRKLPRFPDDKAILMKGRTWRQIAELLEAWRPRPGRGVMVDVTPSGSLIHAAPEHPARLRFEPYILQGDRLHVAPGSVFYVEAKNRKDTDDEEDAPAARFIEAKIPTLEGAPLTDDPPPYFGVSGKSGGALWLICRYEDCGQSRMDEDDAERIELTGKSAKPDIDKGEVAVKIAEFDLEDAGDGKRRLDNLIHYLESDWEQPFTCGGDFNDDSDAGLWESGDDDPDSAPGGDSSDSGESGESMSDDSGDDDPDPPAGCKVAMTVVWVNRVSCFPARPNMEGLKCIPGPFTFRLRCQFWGVDPFNIPCSAWAYGVKVLGSTTPEQIWMNDRDRILEFEFDYAPACQKITVQWRARGFALADPDGDGPEEPPESCCGSLFSGSVTSKVGMPRVCGDCHCSSAGDVDGDGIPNDQDPDFEPDP